MEQAWGEDLTNFGYNGYYAGTVTDVKEVEYNKKETVVEIAITGSKSQYGESYYITNDNKPLLNKINQLLVACGKAPVTKATAFTQVNAMIKSCIGADVAIALAPKTTARGTFHAINLYAMPVLTVKSRVGEVVEVTAAPKKIAQTGHSNNEPASAPIDDIPF